PGLSITRGENVKLDDLSAINGMCARGWRGGMRRRRRRTASSGDVRKRQSGNTDVSMPEGAGRPYTSSRAGGPRPAHLAHGPAVAGVQGLVAGEDNTVKRCPPFVRCHDLRFPDSACVGHKGREWRAYLG